jgi:hypothetical protein
MAAPIIWQACATNVPEIFWPWERHMPFWAWSIVPYWTLNLFYAAAFFCCQNRAQIHRLLQQLLLAQAIAVLCFIAYPLTFTWEKPLTDGLTGRLFSALAGFDQPYNQAPSLHIILTMIIGRFYWYRFAQWARPLWLAWLLLIAVSVLTTYQHHFIDIPTGVLVGCLVLWLLPWQGNQAASFAVFRFPSNPFLSLPKPKRSPAHLRWLWLYASGAVVLSLLAFGLQAAWYGLFWPALALLWLAAVYGHADAAAWQKQVSGKHTLAVSLFALPLRLMYRANMVYWLRGKPCLPKSPSASMSAVSWLRLTFTPWSMCALNTQWHTCPVITPPFPCWTWCPQMWRLCAPPPMPCTKCCNSKISQCWCVAPWAIAAVWPWCWCICCAKGMRTIYRPL